MSQLPCYICFMAEFKSLIR